MPGITFFGPSKYGSYTPGSWKFQIGVAKKKKHHLVFVIDYLSSQSVKDRTFDTNYTKKIMDGFLRVMNEKIAGHKLKLGPSVSYDLINFYDFPIYKLSGGKRKAAEQAATQRVKKFIHARKPDGVVFVGMQGAENCCTEFDPRKAGWVVKTFYNTPAVFSYSWMSPPLGSSGGELNSPNALGIAAIQTGAILRGQNLYQIQVTPHPILIDTLPKLKKALALCSTGAVGFDTETRNLLINNNRVYVIQLSDRPDRAFIIPVYHPETPWSGKDFPKVIKALTKFFAAAPSEDSLLVGFNLKFDLIRLRVDLKLPLIDWPLWDTRMAQHALDENIKEFRNLNVRYDNMATLCMFFGSDVYLRESGFTKKDRKDMDSKAASLGNPDFLTYCAYDSQNPLAIMHQQLELAKREKFGWEGESYYPVYKSFVSTQVSNNVQTFSYEEQDGMKVDMAYLLSLQGNNSDISQRAAQLKKEFMQLPEVKKAEKLLKLEAGVPSRSLIPGMQKSYFNIDDREHLLVLFFDILNLKSVTEGKTGPSLGKVFQEEYLDIPAVKMYQEYTKIKHLKSSFIAAFIKHMVTNEDNRETNRIHARFDGFYIVTGRGNSSNPSFQQLPAHGVLAKVFARIFIPEEGNIFMEPDYSAHEVRLWAIGADDRELGSLFQKGYMLRKKWMDTEDPKVKLALETFGDVHRLNCQRFFGTHPTKVTTAQRQSVKQIVFGAIYGMTVRSLATELGISEEEAKRIVDKMFLTYPDAAAYLKKLCTLAQQHNYVFSPLGRKRSLYGHILTSDPSFSFLAHKMDNRAKNSPIQGMGADIAHTSAFLFKKSFHSFCTKYGYTSLGTLKLLKMVHDSMRFEVSLPLTLIATHILAWVATTGVEKYYTKLRGIDWVADFELEFKFIGLGNDEGKWDWSFTQLEEIICKRIENMQSVYPNLDPQQEWDKMLAEYNKHKDMLSKKMPFFESCIRR